MKQYDKIWVPVPHSEAVNDCEARTIGVKYYKPEKGVLCITLEELKEVCIAMVKEWVEETSDGSSIEEETANDLKKYLQSKGINNI